MKSFYDGDENVNGRIVKIEDVEYPDWLDDIDLAQFFRKTRPKFQLVVCIFDHKDCTVGVSVILSHTRATTWFCYQYIVYPYYGELTFINILSPSLTDKYFSMKLYIVIPLY